MMILHTARENLLSLYGSGIIILNLKTGLLQRIRDITGLGQEGFSANVYGAKNSLTQRAYGPHCVSETKINVAGLNPGDYAGLCAFQDSYGIIGVTCDKDGRKYIIQGEGKFDEQDDGFYNKVPVNENERVSEPLEADEVCVKIEYDFSYTATTIADKADFYYSTDTV